MGTGGWHVFLSKVMFVTLCPQSFVLRPVWCPNRRPTFLNAVSSVTVPLQHVNSVSLASTCPHERISSRAFFSVLLAIRAKELPTCEHLRRAAWLVFSFAGAGAAAEALRL